jgi:hypothetical protein
MLPSDTMALDDDGQDHYAPDNINTATHSSPISTIRTPPDFSAAVHMQHQQFAKQLDGATCFDLDSVVSVTGSLHPYQTGFEMAQDPFGLDASLFSI